MTEVVSIRFKNRGKAYFFAPAGIAVPEGADVIVETAKGLELGQCSRANHYVVDERVVQPLRAVVRLATAADKRVADINKNREKEAFGICQKKILEHGLDMKLVDVECSFEGNKTTFFFTSDGRVDFRELVKDLAGVFRNRIELRQIGVRDEAKMLGGLGICGRPFCCSQFLEDFQPVSTKMAKVQSMSLNPTKISGTCGRLMCCLAFEQEAYEEFHSSCPKMGKKYITNAGVIKVLRSSIFRNTLSLLPEEGDEYEVSLEDWQAMDPVRQGQIQQPKKQASKPVEQAESPEPQNGDRNTHQPGQRQERNRRPIEPYRWHGAALQYSGKRPCNAGFRL